MPKFSFSLVLSGVPNLTPRLANALFEATDGDIELNMRDGVAFAEFERNAPTLQQAIATAIQEIQSSKADVGVLRVETEAANVVARINADLIGIASREFDRPGSDAPSKTRHKLRSESAPVVTC
jgi:hypothetical protein